MEELPSLLAGHLKHVVNGFVPVFYLQRFFVVASAFAHVAGNVNVRQEVHFDGKGAVAAAGLAAPALYVEGKAPLAVAARLCLRRGSEHGADIVEQPDIGRGVGPRIAPYRRLVDLYDLVDLVGADYLAVLAGDHGIFAQSARQRVVKHRVDKRRFSGAGNAGNSDKPPERDRNVDVL